MPNIITRAVASLQRQVSGQGTLYPQQGFGTWFSFGGGARQKRVILSQQQQLETAWGWVHRAVGQKADDVALLGASAETRKGKKWENAPDQTIPCKS